MKGTFHRLHSLEAKHFFRPTILYVTYYKLFLYNMYITVSIACKLNDHFAFGMGNMQKYANAENVLCV